MKYLHISTHTHSPASTLHHSLHLHQFLHDHPYSPTTHLSPLTHDLRLLYHSLHHLLCPCFSSLPLPPHPSLYRSIESDMNVFQGLVSNPIFVGILLFTVVAQYGLVEFGGAFVRTVRTHTRIYIHAHTHACTHVNVLPHMHFSFFSRLCLPVFTVIPYFLFNLI